MIEIVSPDARPLRADARRNRERILEAANGVFAEAGSGIQMDLVARRAGVGVGTVYRHFPDKERLLVELASYRFRACVQEAERALMIDDPWAAVESFVRQIADHRLLDAGLRDVLAMLQPGRCHCPAERDELVARLDELLARAHRAGAVRHDVRGADLLALISGAGTAIGQGIYTRLVADVLLAGLRPTPAEDAAFPGVGADAAGDPVGDSPDRPVAVAGHR
ncbi:TetR/AcrR family transcriptional regulator [Dactylosporangium sp. NPDC051485]|uniref:TetR/AcrR family transcriptional regulator n=1 Tax=Dactylosporangium sp. NPDC051485 TaxID=3154846 RepID=UPI00341C50DA